MSWLEVSMDSRFSGGRKSTSRRKGQADVRWTLFPLTDAVWAMFYYTQLYICAFSFVSCPSRAPLTSSKHMSNERQCEPMKNTRCSKSSIKPADRPRTYLDRHSACSREAQLLVQTPAISCSATTLRGPFCGYVSTICFLVAPCLIFLRGTSYGSPMLLSSC